MSLVFYLDTEVQKVLERFFSQKRLQARLARGISCVNGNWFVTLLTSMDACNFYLQQRLAAETEPSLKTSFNRFKQLRNEGSSACSLIFPRLSFEWFCILWKKWIGFSSPNEGWKKAKKVMVVAIWRNGKVQMKKNKTVLVKSVQSQKKKKSVKFFPWKEK